MDERERKNLEKEREDILLLIKQLEEEHSKANITDQVYNEMKEKYEKRLKEINKKLGIKEEKKDGGGLFSKLFKKKKEESKEVGNQENQEEGPVFIDPMNPQQASVEEENKLDNIEVEKDVSEKVSIELERIRAFIDSLKDMNKSLGEQIRMLSESIGEVRSATFQVDAALKEIEVKVEKLEESIKEISPEKFEKKIKEIDSNFEKIEVFKEIVNKKIEDITNNLSKVNELLKSVGSIENFLEMYKSINEKVNEIKEAISYIERIATKTEKSFIEMNKYLQDFVLYKGKQDALEEEIKEVIKNLEEIKSKLENSASLKDIDALRYDILSIKNQIDEINKVLPIVETKIPETIIKLREERDDLLLLLNSLETQMKEGKISKKSYEESKKKALQKLDKIREELIKEWKKIEAFVESGGLEQIPSVSATKEEKPEKMEEKIEVGKIEKIVEKSEVSENIEEESVEEKEDKSKRKTEDKKRKKGSYKKESKVQDISEERKDVRELLSSISKEDEEDFIIRLVKEIEKKKKEKEIEKKKKQEMLLRAILDALE
ncbi:MAG: hypothetical protein QXW01_00080 [Candidatus Aenigmatarchaeota archaeon]